MENQVLSTPPWWVLAFAGIVSILFGIAALVWPGMTLVVLVWLWGAYAVAYGIIQLVAMFRAIGAHTTWWTHLLMAIISIVAGIFVFAYTLMSTIVLAIVIAIWAIAMGVVEIVAGLEQASFLTVVVGIISILFGFVLFGNPAAGAVALVWVIGIFAIVRGVVLLVAAIRAPTGGAAAT